MPAAHFANKSRRKSRHVYNEGTICCIVIQAAGSCVSRSSQAYPNVRQRVETRGVAGVDADSLSERSGHELAVVASRDAVARFRGRFHLMRDGVRGLVCSPLDGNQGLLAEKGWQAWIATGKRLVGVGVPWVRGK